MLLGVPKVLGVGRQLVVVEVHRVLCAELGMGGEGIGEEESEFFLYDSLLARRPLRELSI